MTGVISEEVFVKQPPEFQDLKHRDYVYKLKKSLYGLKQAPIAWYDRLSNFLLKNDFKRGQVDTTLFKKTLEKDILIVQIYVDDIIFGSTNASLCKEALVKSSWSKALVKRPILVRSTGQKLLM